MGYSNCYQVSSLRSGVTNYRDYAKQLHSISSPTRLGVLRTWADYNYNMCLSKTSGNTVKVMTAFVATGTTTSLTPVVLKVDGCNILLTKNRACLFTSRILCVPATANVAYAKEIKGVINIGATNNTTLLLAPTVDTIILDLGNNFTAIATADTTNGALTITVTGSPSLTIRWCASVELLEL